MAGRRAMGSLVGPPKYGRGGVPVGFGERAGALQKWESAPAAPRPRHGPSTSAQTAHLFLEEPSVRG